MLMTRWPQVELNFTPVTTLIVTFWAKKKKKTIKIAGIIK